MRDLLGWPAGAGRGRGAAGRRLRRGGDASQRPDTARSAPTCCSSSRSTTRALESAVNATDPVVTDTGNQGTDAPAVLGNTSGGDTGGNTVGNVSAM